MELISGTTTRNQKSPCFYQYTFTHSLHISLEPGGLWRVSELGKFLGVGESIGPRKDGQKQGGEKSERKVHEWIPSCVASNDV